MPLPETCEHHYSCQESDKWGGVPYSVDLSERMEVTCLEGESSRLNWRKMWGKELNTLLNRSESFPFKNPSADATIIQCHPLAGFLWKKPELKKVSIEKAWFQQSLCAWGRVCVCVPQIQARCHHWNDRRLHKLDTFQTSHQQCNFCTHTLTKEQTARML